MSSLQEKRTITVMRDPSDSDRFIASIDNDDNDEATNLAYKGTLAEAITEALSVFGLEDDDVYIEASN